MKLSRIAGVIFPFFFTIFIFEGNLKNKMIFTKWRCKYYDLLELYFKLENDKHQGNPISDYLFILAWEICSSWKKTNENIDGFKCLRLLISLLSLRTCESLLWICYRSVKVCYGSCYYNRSIFKLFGIKMKQFQMLNRAMYKQFKIMNLSILEKLYCFSSLKKYIWWCNRLMNIRN